MITDCSTSFGSSSSGSSSSSSSSSSSASSSSSCSSSSIASHVNMIVVPIFNRKIISMFDSRAAGAGMSIAMLLDNYYKFDLISEARWIPNDSSSQSKTTKVLKYAFNDDPMLNKTLSTLYKLCLN